MTCEESIKWLENLHADLGGSQYQVLWHYEQALAETIELLQSDRLVELPCKVGEELFLTDHPMYHYRLGEYKFIGDFLVMVIECVEFPCICKKIVDEEFGVTVFTDKAKAEAKLKELEK